jgi:asparagine synthase (glutamine-hydrolysing)
MLRLQAMANHLVHRGPDDSGFYTNESGTVGFAHRRLKIIDLSDAAHQPMLSDDGTKVVVYNGEIYNYKELDEELKGKGYVYRSHSDTETLLHSYEEWGEDCVRHFNGMFAFALWDERQQKIFCARDRFGEKPFYYFHDQERFIFASEIKALFAAPSVPKQPNRKVIARYLLHGLTDADCETFFENILSLPAAHTLTLSHGQISIERYWALDPTAQDNETTDDAWEDTFIALFKDSVRLRLRSDVPLGSCLSGGLDSSSIVCLMRQIDEQPVSTFSVLYDESAYAEASFVRSMVEGSTLRAHEIKPTGEDLFATLDRITWHNDEPSNGIGQYSQWQVMKLAAERGVTVILNGQGGDELLAGYHHYLVAALREHALRGHGLTAWRQLRLDAAMHGESIGSRLKQAIYPLLPRWIQRGYTRAFSGKAMAQSLIAPDLLATEDGRLYRNDFTALNDSLWYDLTVATVPYLVHSEDRCSMAFSREIRLPFLDHRLVELMFRMPSRMKIRDGVTKYILRKTMAAQGLPAAIVNRHDKKGYPTPLSHWLRTLAYSQAREMLRSLGSRGLVDGAGLEALLKRHADGHSDDSVALWRFVCLEAWFRVFIDQK